MEALRGLGPHSFDFDQLVGAGAHERLHGAEALKQSVRRHGPHVGKSFHHKAQLSLGRKRCLLHA